MTHTKDDLKALQALDLNRKILVTQARITEWYLRNDGNVHVSFSGGKDSTVLLHIVRQLYPDVPAVYIDTGLEYPEVRDFVKSIPNVTWLKPKMNFRKVIEHYGYPLISKEVSRDVAVARRKPDGKTAQKFIHGSDYHKKYGDRWLLKRWDYLLDAPFNISNQCCNVMKKNTAKAYEKQAGTKPFVATMACESQLRQAAWLKHGCNAFDANRQQSTPMAFWTEQDVLKYIHDYNIPYAECYGDIIVDGNGKYKTTKCDRTGCVFCGFGAHLEKEPNRFQRLKETHPQLYDYCMRPWNRGGWV